MMDKENDSCALEIAAHSFDGLPWRVLLATPEVRHIPAFAFGAAAVRQDYRIEPLHEATADRLVTPRRLRTLGEHQPSYAFISVRCRTGQSAMYSSWLAFGSPEGARDFASNEPGFGRDTLKGRTSEVFEQANGRLARNVAEGVFDLCRLSKDRRLDTAKRYVERHEEVDRLREELDRLDLLGADPFRGRVGTSVG